MRGGLKAWVEEEMVCRIDNQITMEIQCYLFYSPGEHLVSCRMAHLIRTRIINYPRGGNYLSVRSVHPSYSHISSDVLTATRK